MKKFNFSILAAMLIFVFQVAPVSAQTEKSEQTRAWKQFQAAISKNDKSAVAAMIKFPFEASIVGGELDYKVETKADFIKNYARIFTAARRKQIARGKIVPTPGEDAFGFEMFEDGGYQVFTFRKIGGAYKLVGTMAAG
jgi:hypothetical protein